MSNLLIIPDKDENQSFDQKLTVNFVFANVGFKLMQRFVGEISHRTNSLIKTYIFLLNFKIQSI